MNHIIEYQYIIDQNSDYMIQLVRLRVVQTQTIIFFRAMSERDGSDIVYVT